MFHFSFWMVSIVRAATCGRALSWKNDTDVCALFVLFLMFLSSIEGVVYFFHTTITDAQYSRQLADSYPPVLPTTRSLFSSIMEVLGRRS